MILFPYATALAAGADGNKVMTFWHGRGINVVYFIITDGKVIPTVLITGILYGMGVRP